MFDSAFELILTNHRFTDSNFEGLDTACFPPILGVCILFVSIIPVFHVIGPA